MKIFEKNKLILYFLVIILIFLSLSLLGSLINFKKNIEKDKLNIFVTVGAVYLLTKEIGGNKVALNAPNIIFQKGHAHDVELLPSDINNINNANVILLIGYNFDNWILDYIKNTNTKIFYLNNNITPILYAKNNINPHYWLSLENSSKLAVNIYNILSTIDPKNRIYYQKNLDNFIYKLDELKNKYKNLFKNLSNRNIIITHPSFDYLSKDLGLTIIFTLKNLEGQDILPKEVLKLSKLIKEKNVKVIVIEEGFQDDFSLQVSKIFDLKVSYVDPMEILKNNELTYIQILQKNLDSIYNSLK
jgi:zinc transport system substrate-binding protein